MKKLREKKGRDLYWDRLDNTANLFPVIAGETLTNVYRICVTLTEDVQPNLLQEALDLVLPKFKGFNLRLRFGLFWFYFEENGKAAPRVHKENNYPCRYIRENRNNNYLFRVTYYKNRINLEVFHALTDGMGGYNFLTELTYQYLRLSHPKLRKKYGDALSPNTSLNREDSFLKNCPKRKKGKAYGSGKAFLMNGERLPKGEFGVMHVYVPVAEIKKTAKSKGASINDFLVANTIYAIYMEQYRNRRKKRPIRISVPVNLRPYFESITTKNFFVMVSIEFEPQKEEYTFDEVLEITKEEVRKKITKENLEITVSYNVAKAENIIGKFVPLPLKNIAMNIVYRFIARANTTTVTNIGALKVEEAYAPYITMFHGILSVSQGQLLKGTICSYGDTLVYTFSTLYKDTGIEKRFCKTLVEEGISVRVESNGVFQL